jgi:hypothetical protein
MEVGNQAVSVIRFAKVTLLTAEPPSCLPLEEGNAADSACANNDALQSYSCLRSRMVEANAKNGKVFGNETDGPRS